MAYSAAWRLAGRLVGAAVIVGACASHSDGDPGDRGLHQLAADPVFGRLPPGAERRELKLTPASYQKPGFGGGGSSGPSVRLVFDRSGDPHAVYRFVGREAEAAGWTAAATGSIGLPDRWRKAYPNGALATLSVFTPRPFEPAPDPRRYELSGGISLTGRR